MTPQELRSSVFRFAISGKLTRQNELENSKSAINYAIGERKKAENTKAIKKEKNIKPINDDEIPFEIPENWTWVRLIQISSIEAGGTPDRGTPEYWNGDVPWLKIGDINSKHVTNCTEYITKLGLDNSSAKIFNKGTILYTIFATIGRVGILDFDASTNQAIAGITFYGNLNRDYLYYVLVSLKDVLVAQSHGMAQMNINQAILKQTPIPIPPLEEQDRIVAKIEELLPLVDRYEEAYNKLEKLNKKFPIDLEKSIAKLAIEGKLVSQIESEGSGVFVLKEVEKTKQKLVKNKKIKQEKDFNPIDDDEKPYKIPNNWCWARFGELGSYKKGPFGSALTKDMFVPKGPHTIKVYEQKNAIKKDATIGDYYIKENYFEDHMKGFEVFPGDIIVSCAGTIGETYVLPQSIEKGIINQALMRMKIFEPLHIPYFLLFFDTILKKNAKSASSGSAIKNIPPFDVLKNYVVPIPPLGEQKRIVEKLEELLPLCRKLVK